jgi:hypothetical protein
MAVAYQSTEATSDSSTSPSVSKPTGTAAGDLLIAVFDLFRWTSSTLPSVSSAPSGFTLIGTVTSQSGTDSLRQSVYYRIADGTEGSTFSGTTSADWTGFFVHRFTGAHATTPINTSASWSSGGWSLNRRFPSVTTTAADCLLVANWHIWSADPISPSGWTQEWDIDGGDNDQLWSKLQASAGASGNTNFNDASDYLQCLSYVLAIEPAASVVDKSSSDTGSGADSQSVTVVRTVTDTGSGADATGARTASRTVTETGSGADTTGARTATRTVTDTGAGADATGARTATRTVTETGAGSDGQTTAAALSSSDTGSGAETQSAGVPNTDSDTGAGSDGSTVAAAVTTADTGAGAEAQTIAVAVSATDTGSGAETQSAGAPKSDADTGAGTDGSALTVAVPGSDTGSGTDAGALVVSITVTDTGAGADAGSAAGEDQDVDQVDIGYGTEAVLERGLSTADTGTGVETETVLYFVRFVVDADVGVGHMLHHRNPLAAITALSAYTGGTRNMDDTVDWEPSLVERMRRRG